MSKRNRNHIFCTGSMFLYELVRICKFLFMFIRNPNAQNKILKSKSQMLKKLSTHKTKNQSGNTITLGGQATLHRSQTLSAMAASMRSLLHRFHALNACVGTLGCSSFSEFVENCTALSVGSEGKSIHSWRIHVSLVHPSERDTVTPPDLIRPVGRVYNKTGCLRVNVM